MQILWGLDFKRQKLETLKREEGRESVIDVKVCVCEKTWGLAFFWQKDALTKLTWKTSETKRKTSMKQVYSTKKEHRLSTRNLRIRRASAVMAGHVESLCEFRKCYRWIDIDPQLLSAVILADEVILVQKILLLQMQSANRHVMNIIFQLA